MANTAVTDNANQIVDQNAVANEEHSAIQMRRKEVGFDAARQEVNEDLVGLSFSGGGIRSATFCLGVLQGLAKLKFLPRIDYLSTVSGGGYIGAWFVALVKRAPFGGNIQAVQTALNDAAKPSQTAGDEQQNNQQQRVGDSLRYLQANSNYLTQKTGLMSLDTWVLLGIYLRNLLATQLCLLPVMFAVPIAAHLMLGLLNDEVLPPMTLWLFYSILIFTVLGLSYLFIKVIAGDQVIAGDGSPNQNRADAPPPEQQSGWLAVVLTATAVGWTCLLSSKFESQTPWELALGVRPFASDCTFQFNEFVRFIVLFALLRLPLALVVGKRSLFAKPWTIAGSTNKLKYWGVATVVGAVVGALLYLAGLWMNTPKLPPQLLVTLGPPLILLLLMITTFLEAVLPGYLHDEFVREAWATYSALCLMCALGWLAVMGVSLFGVNILKNAQNVWTTSGITLSWLIVTGVGLFAGQSANHGEGKSRGWVDVLASLAPYLFLVGMGCVMSWGVHHLPGLPQSERPDSSVDPTGHPWVLFCWLVGLLFLSTLLGRWLDVNDVSLNALYANRLTRAYLGASNPKRFKHNAGQPFRRSRFLESDDLWLPELVPGTTTGQGYSGPFLLVNTALNLAGGDNLAWQERKAASFVISPLHMGSAELQGEKPKKQDGKSSAGENGKQSPKGAYFRHPLQTPKELRQGMLGRAISISGAAANPNMGYHSSSAITALMTFFNVRLGWWLPNPIGGLTSDRRPSSVLACLLRELFGYTTDKSQFLNVSDGGHFENLGVYELVRRRCRLVIAVDGEADPDLAFHGLGTLIRRCRTDLDCDIEIDVDRLRRDPATGRSREHFAIGTIRYDQKDPTHPVGTLVYIKATLTGDEPTDVNQYAQAHADFPHQTTADQFFDESQFESYRQLGFHCVSNAFRPLLPNLEESLWQQPVEELVYELRRNGFPPPPESHHDFLEAVQPFAELHKSFRDETSLAKIAREMYGDFVNDSDPPEQLKAIHTSILMMQVLENAWFALNLKEQHSHPLNTGWMNLLHRWSQIPAVRDSWPVIRHEYSRGFVKFCETVGGLPKPETRFSNAPSDIATIRQTFADDQDFETSGLKGALESAVKDPANTQVEMLFMDVPPKSSQGVPVGCLVIANKPENISQLYVWVRPRYRGHGHGVWLLDRFEKVLREKSAKVNTPVRIEIPDPPHTTHTSRAIDKARLLSFFTRYGFRKAKDEVRRKDQSSGVEFTPLERAM